MLGKEKYGSIVNLVMNITIGTVLSVVGLSLSGKITGVALLQNILISMGIGYILGDWIPVYVMGLTLATKMGIKNRLLHHMVSILVLCIIFVTLASFVCMFVAFGTAMIPVWLACLPFYLSCGYITLLIAMPIASKIAAVLTGFDPAPMINT